LTDFPSSPPHPHTRGLWREHGIYFWHLHVWIWFLFFFIVSLFWASKLKGASYNHYRCCCCCDVRTSDKGWRAGVRGYYNNTHVVIIVRNSGAPTALGQFKILCLFFKGSLTFSSKLKDKLYIKQLCLLSNIMYTYTYTQERNRF